MSTRRKRTATASNRGAPDQKRDVTPDAYSHDPPEHERVEKRDLLRCIREWRSGDRKGAVAIWKKLLARAKDYKKSLEQFFSFALRHPEKMGTFLLESQNDTTVTLHKINTAKQVSRLLLGRLTSESALSLASPAQAAYHQVFSESAGNSKVPRYDKVPLPGDRQRFWHCSIMMVIHCWLRVLPETEFTNIVKTMIYFGTCKSPKPTVREFLGWDVFSAEAPLSDDDPNVGRLFAGGGAAAYACGFSTKCVLMRKASAEGAPECAGDMLPGEDVLKVMYAIEKRLAARSHDSKISLVTLGMAASISQELWSHQQVPSSVLEKQTTKDPKATPKKPRKRRGNGAGGSRSKGSPSKRAKRSGGSDRAAGSICLDGILGEMCEIRRHSFRGKLIQAVAKKFCEKINSETIPLDLCTTSGLAARQALGLKPPSNLPIDDEGGRMSATIVVLSEQKLGKNEITDDPVVLHLTNKFSKDFKAKDDESTDNTKFVIDENSGMGEACVGAFHHCPSCSDAHSSSHPVFKVGSRNAVVSVKADQMQRHKMAIATEVAQENPLEANRILLFANKRFVDSIISSGSEERMRDYYKTVLGWEWQVRPVGYRYPIQSIPEGETSDCDAAIPDGTSPAAGIGAEILHSVVERAFHGLTGGKMWTGNFCDDMWIERFLNDHLADNVEISDLMPIPLQVVDSQLTKVGPAVHYGSHQDSDRNLVSSIGSVIKRLTAGVLPLMREMPVVTFIGGRGDDATDVVWTRKEKSDSVLGRITTLTNDAHIQVGGVQDRGIFHHSAKSASASKKRARSSSEQLAVRQVDTFRMTACPVCDPGWYSVGMEETQLTPSHIQRHGLRVQRNYRVSRVLQQQRQYDKQSPDVPIPVTLDPAATVAYRKGKESELVRAPELPTAGFDERRISEPGENSSESTAIAMEAATEGSEPEDRASTGLAMESAPSPEGGVHGGEAAPGEGVDRGGGFPTVAKFDKLPAGKYDDYLKQSGLKRQSPRVAMHKKERRRNIIHCKIQERALVMGKILRVYDEDRQLVPYQPLLTVDGRPLLPGMSLRAEQMPAKSTRRAKFVISENFPNLAVASHGYKNNMVLFDAFLKELERLAVMEKEGLSAEGYETWAEGVHGMLLKMCYCGGSGTKADSNPPTNANATPLDVQFIAGGPQTLGQAENVGFSLAVENQGPVAIFVHEGFWGKTTTKVQKTKRAGETQNEVEPAEDEAEVARKILLHDENRLLDGIYRFFGYFQPVGVAYGKLTKKEVVERFATHERYYASERMNTNFLMAGFSELTLRPAFSPRAMTKMYMNSKKADFSYGEIPVWEGDRTPVWAAVSDLRPLGDESLDQPMADSIPPDESVPLDEVHDDHVAECISRLPDSDFVARVASPMDENMARFLTVDDHLYKTDVEGMVAVSINIMGACSKRVVDKDSATARYEKAGKPKFSSTPIRVKKDSALPPTLIGRSTPCSNPDADKGVQFFHHACAAPYIQKCRSGQHITRGVDPADPNYKHLSHTPLDPADPNNKHLLHSPLELNDATEVSMLTTLLFMAILNRLLGKVGRMSLFTGGAGVHLPDREGAEDWLQWLTANRFVGDTCVAVDTKKPRDNIMDLVSEQHASRIPDILKKNFGVFTSFVRVLAGENPHGFSRVYQLLLSSRDARGRVPRGDLIECLASVMSDCGDLQGDSKLGFIACKAVLDVEGLFPGFVTQPLATDMTHGYGSDNGLPVLTRETTGTFPERIHYLHDKLRRQLDTLSEQELGALGCARVVNPNFEDIAALESIEDDAELWKHGYSWNQPIKPRRGSKFLAALEKMSEAELTEAGYERVPHARYGNIIYGKRELLPRIVSIFTGRDFSLADTEHWLCKIWIVVMYSHASRDLSKEPQASSQATYPVPEHPAWISHCVRCMEQVSSCYNKCEKEPDSVVGRFPELWNRYERLPSEN